MRRYRFDLFLLYFCIFIANIQSVKAEKINLEEKFAQQGIILKTQKINIPGFPLAFNPSLVRWKDRLLMSIRIIPDRRFNFTSYIGLIWLDDNFNPIGFPQFLDIRDNSSTIPSRAEDARLITVGDKLFMVYDDNEEALISKGGFRVYVAELFLNQNNIFKLRNRECLSAFEGENKNIREKSWVPFVNNNQLLLSYSLIPHTIFKPRLDQSNSCETIAKSNFWGTWEYGIPRGGTPALMIDNTYLAFFHSSKPIESAHSKGETMWHYFIGAYTFAAKEPFEIKQISSEPIVGQGFYNGIEYRPYWKPVKVVFPGGYIMDEESIWIVYGRDDHEIWIAQLDKENLLASLTETIPQ